MTVKDFVKALTPPAALQLQRRIRGRETLRFYWRGVYKTFSEVPAKGRGFQNSVWLESARKMTEQYLQIRKHPHLISSHVPLAHSLLPLLAALSGDDEDPCRILDFGGALGVGYLGMLECLPRPGAIDYHIVENPDACRIGEELFRDDPQVHFHRVIPDSLQRITLVYFSTSLQYVEDYPGLLRQLAALRPKFFLFVSLQAGHNPTFVSEQLNFEDQSVVPCWFFNIEEIAALMKSLGYELRFKSTTDRVYDMTNFEPAYQVPRYCNLLFADISLNRNT